MPPVQDRQRRSDAPDIRFGLFFPDRASKMVLRLSAVEVLGLI
jgi:hypothetical protein